MDELLHYKRIALLIATVAILCHGIRLWKDGSDTCQGLLSHGWWRSNGLWQPYGCTMHVYKSSESVRCLSGKRVAILGDSRMRDLFHHLEARLSGNDVTNIGPKHGDMSYSDDSNKIRINFHWAPVIDRSVHKLFESMIKKSSFPDIVLHASALWHMKTRGTSPAVVRQFQENLTALSEAFYSKRTKQSLVVWFQQYPLAETMLDTRDDPIRYTNEHLRQYDEAANKALSGSGVAIMRSFREAIGQRLYEDTLDGMHYSGKSMNLAIDLVLNVACNEEIEPADATCCLGSGIEISPVQIITGIVFLTCAIATFFVGRKVRISQSQPQNPQNSEKSSDSPLYHSYVVLKNLSKFGLILAFFYICDRTPIFMKEAKVYGLGSFLACLGVLFLVGIASGKEASKADYLNRDQTDEWKGWMQLIILAYHYLGASADLRVYVWIRVLVASYLFMSAYGHFNYFWNKGDYSLYRFSQVMLRMNLLTVLLCYTMNRPYQFYYFMPLISFFYVLVYLTHVAWPQVDASKAKDGKKAIWLMLGKIGVLAIVCSLLWKSLTIFSALFSWWPLIELFRAEKEDSLVREWWFRSGLDRFMAPYGMLFAFILLLAKNFKLINTDSTQWPLRSIFSWIILLLSSAAMLGYGYFSVTCPNKPDCNASHSWISFLPITAFVFLRNVPPFLRSQYSAFFAWTGKISLELFIGQYHIWLANDTHSLLVVIPGYPLVNAVVTTFVFVCAAHEISSICGVLTSYAVTKDTRAMLKRIAAVAVALALTLLLHVLTKKY